MFRLRRCRLGLRDPPRLSLGRHFPLWRRLERPARVCNVPVEGQPPRMPDGFRTVFDKDGGDTEVARAARLPWFF